MISNGPSGTQLLKHFNHLLSPHAQEKSCNGLAQEGGKDNPTVLAWSEGKNPLYS